MQQAKFMIGQIIHHKLFNYRGVIVNVDPTMQLSEEWYNQVARSRPPKDKPWYHVLVDQQTHITYVAEQNIMPEEDQSPILHPLINEYFDGLQNGQYKLKPHNVN